MDPNNGSNQTSTSQPPYRTRLGPRLIGVLGIIMLSVLLFIQRGYDPVLRQLTTPIYNTTARSSFGHLPRDNPVDDGEQENVSPSNMSTEIPYSDCESAKLMPDNSQKLVALQSFPGSGNTWVRYLLERATGIFTGSVFCDRSLSTGGFEGECQPMTCRCTIAVKMHATNPRLSEVPWEGGILLMRNPYDALIAERNRKSGGSHAGLVERSYFKGDEWKKYVKRQTRRWGGFFKQATKLFSKNLLIVHYEDLKEDLGIHIRRMVQFLGPVSATEERIECTVAYPTGKFKRTKRKRTFDPYSEEQKRTINATIADVLRQLKEAHLPLPPYAKDYL